MELQLSTARERHLSGEETTYRRYFPIIRQKCRRMLGEHDADDVAQETFVRLLRARLAGEPELRVLGWIYRTSTRLAIDLLRRQARRGGREGDGAAAELVLSQAGADDALAHRRELRALVDALPQDELEMALLHRIDGLTQEEIAQAMGVSARTVRRALSRLDGRTRELRGKGRLE